VSPILDGSDRDNRFGRVLQFVVRLLQVAAAHQTGLSEFLLASANASGGALGKMISLRNLAVGAAAAGLAGCECELF
jgi:L-lactate permease